MQTPDNKNPFRLLCNKYLILAALSLLAILVVTGIFLNHAKSLELDQKTIASDWLLDWYGLNPEGNATSFALDDARITQWGDKVFFDDHLLTDTQDQLLGAAHAGKNILVVALTNSLLLLDANGELIEQTSPGFMPIRKFGSNGKLIVVEAQDGKLYRSDKNIVSWQAIDTGNVQWSQPGKLPTEWQQKIKRAWRGNGLTTERVIMDLHSGRIINASWGVYIMDAGAIILLLLGISGSWMWWSHKQKTSGK